MKQRSAKISFQGIRVAKGNPSVGLCWSPEHIIEKAPCRHLFNGFSFCLAQRPICFRRVIPERIFIWFSWNPVMVGLDRKQEIAGIAGGMARRQIFQRACKNFGQFIASQQREACWLFRPAHTRTSRCTVRSAGRPAVRAGFRAVALSPHVSYYWLLRPGSAMGTTTPRSRNSSR